MTARQMPYGATPGWADAPTPTDLNGVTPAQSAERARQIVETMRGDAKHRSFDQLINNIARQHGHGEAVEIFEMHATAYHLNAAPMTDAEKLAKDAADEACRTVFENGPPNAEYRIIAEGAVKIALAKIGGAE